MIVLYSYCLELDILQFDLVLALFLKLLFHRWIHDNLDFWRLATLHYLNVEEPLF